MNCQVRARLILRRNCFGVVGPKRAASNVGMIRRFGPELGLPADVVARTILVVI
jgi:hypothetical protein